MIKKTPISLLVIVVSLFESCAVSKETTDSLAIKKIKKNSNLIQEMAAFAIKETYSTDIRYFHISTVSDKNIRDQIHRFGNDIRISYNNQVDEIIPDSIVSFSSLTLFGKTEIIYDFASRQRIFPDDVTNRSNHYFIRVTDRIYYRRSLFPMM